MSIYEYIKILRRFFGNKKNQETTLRDAIEELIEEDDSQKNGKSSIDDDEREMLGNVLNLRDIHVQDIMVPRAEIKALPTSATMEELFSEFVENQISTILIYQGNIDNITGVVYLKDAVNWFRMNKPFNISIFTKKVLFVPPTMRTLTLLLKMKDTGIKVAVAIDEYGGVEGFASFVDLVEEIIGDIQDADEQKNNKKRVYKDFDGSFISDARITLQKIHKEAGIKLSSLDNSIDTLGGYIFAITGKVPVKGELIFCRKQNVEFEILDADPRRVKTVRIRKKQ